VALFALGFRRFRHAREMEREAKEERAKAREYKRKYFEELDSLNTKVKAVERLLNERHLN
jgi:hypothetical protein